MRLTKSRASTSSVSATNSGLTSSTSTRQRLRYSSKKKKETRKTHRPSSSLSLSLSEITRPQTNRLSQKSRTQPTFLDPSQQPCIDRLTSSCLTSLRFPIPRQVASECIESSHTSKNLHQSNTRVFITQIPFFSLSSIYFSYFPPSLHLFNSLITMLHSKSLARHIQTNLLSISLHPFTTNEPPSSSMSSKDGIAIQFARAVTEYPPRIPADLRTTFSNAYHPDKAYSVAILLSFGAFYSTCACLLGFNTVYQLIEENQSVLEHTSMRDHRSFAFSREMSEISVPLSSVSRRTTWFPFSGRISSTLKHHFYEKLAKPVKNRLSRSFSQQARKEHWSNGIPDSRRQQDDFLRSLMGFCPDYLNQVKNPVHRTTFVYILKSILLREMSDDLSVMAKCLGCYVLARYYENPILAAHSAYLANRYGANNQKLMLCLNMSSLHAMFLAERLGNGPDTNSISSMVSSEASYNISEQFPNEQNILLQETEPLYNDEIVENSCETNEFPEYLAVGGNVTEDESDDGPDSWPNQSPSYDDIDLVEVKQITRRLRPNSSSVHSEVSEDFGGLSDERINHSPPLSATPPNESELLERIREMEKEIPDDIYIDRRRSRSGRKRVSKDLEENPEVPEVDGLNTITPSLSDQEIEEMDNENPLDLLNGRESDDEEIFDGDDSSLELFTQREMAFLLLCHDTARSCRRSKYIQTNYAEIGAQPFMAEDFVSAIHDLFEPAEVMEMISVVASFNFLHRWTVCNPYRQGTLETPVRKFVQSPMAHNLSVDTVGQRVPSKHSASSRGRRKRSTHLS